MHSHQFKVLQTGYIPHVLILVVMDDALALPIIIEEKDNTRS